MQCTACGTTNAPGSKFCGECGASLALTCPNCSTPVEPTAKFCSECGTGLTGDVERAAVATPDQDDDIPSADRRFVSTLFADLVEYTSFAEGRDPDEVRDLLTGYFDRSRAIIEKYGGVVEKFIGDAIFGVWGTEVVREDDAERAVRAGLEMVSMVAALGDEQGHSGLRLRAGVMSGATTVGPGGNESTGMIVGDLVNTAARLQSVAEPGTVFVGRSTHEVTARSIVYEKRGTVLVKGKTDEVEAWRALRPGGRLGAGANMRELPFAGREREMRLLTDWLDATAAEGRSRLVSVTGEAGIGKSRLANEFMNHVDGYADDVFWHRGRSPSYGDGIPMWSLIEMVRQRAGIHEDEDPSRGRTRLRTMLAEFVDDADDRQWIEPWLAGLLSLGELPVGSRSELLAALRSLFQHIARRGTTVLVFEDLHWADDAVVEFISELVDRSTRAPILVIALARPELLERHPGFGSQRASVNLALAGLHDDDMRGLVAEYLGRVEAALVERIVERAAGYPLYAAETIRMLTNDGSLVETGDGFEWRGGEGALAIPETLQAVIGARLDRLDPTFRSVLQDAAVLGLTFHGGALAVFDDRSPDDVEAALRQLVRLDVLEVVDDPRSPERGQYRFVQGLIQELAYDRLNRAERRARHITAAEHFGRDDDPELAGIVAKHYEGAFAASPEGSERDELVQRAIDSLIGAAQRSAALHADSVAMDLYDRALALAPRDPRAPGWCVEAAESARAEGDRDRGLEYLERADRLLTVVPDPHGVRRVAVGRAGILNSFFESGGALAAIEPHYLAMESIDDEIDVRVAAETVRSYSLMARVDDAVAAADRVLPVAERLELTPLVVDVLTSRATALGFGGRPVEAIAGLVGALDAADREGLLRTAVRAVNNLVATMFSIHPRAARAWGPRLREYIARAGVKEYIDRNEHNRAAFDLLDGDPSRSIELLEEAVPEQLSAQQREQVEGLRAQLCIRVASPGWEEAFRNAIEPLRSRDDEQVAATVAAADALFHAARRDWEEAYRQGVAAGLRFASGATLAVYAAVRLGEPDLLDDVQTAVEEETLPGPYRAGHLAFVEAARSGLSGDRQRCVDQCTALLRDLEDVVFEQDLVIVKATFTALVGLEHPAAQRAGDDVLDWIERGGLWGFLTMFGDVLPQRPGLSARAAG
jgi:class 3 adenylate cyclase